MAASFERTRGRQYRSIGSRNIASVVLPSFDGEIRGNNDTVTTTHRQSVTPHRNIFNVVLLPATTTAIFPRTVCVYDGRGARGKWIVRGRICCCRSSAQADRGRAPQVTSRASGARDAIAAVPFNLFCGGTAVSAWVARASPSYHLVSRDRGTIDRWRPTQLFRGNVESAAAGRARAHTQCYQFRGIIPVSDGFFKKFKKSKKKRINYLQTYFVHTFQRLLRIEYVKNSCVNDIQRCLLERANWLRRLRPSRVTCFLKNFDLKKTLKESSNGCPNVRLNY